jgi:hypothetical protein
MAPGILSLREGECFSAEAAAGGALYPSSATRLCPIKHIEHIECIGHGDVDADEATNDWLVDNRFSRFTLE